MLSAPTRHSRQCAVTGTWGGRGAWVTEDGAPMFKRYVCVYIYIYIYTHTHIKIGLNNYYVINLLQRKELRRARGASALGAEGLRRGPAHHAALRHMIIPSKQKRSIIVNYCYLFQRTCLNNIQESARASPSARCRRGALPLSRVPAGHRGHIRVRVYMYMYMYTYIYI